MKTRRHFVMLVLLLTSILCYSQTGRYVLSGEVVDSDGESLPGANISVSSVTDSTTMRTTTDTKGRFSLQDVSAGNYHVTVTYLGFDDYTKDVYISNNVSLGKITLKNSSHMLNEVTVMERYVNVKPSGETVIRVAGNPLAKGKTFINFLRTVRDLDVSNEGVKVQGRDNTLFYLDDKAITFEQFKALSPSMIERIEVVPHADASYGVNASGGVVKVYLRNGGGMLGTLTLYGQADKHGYVDGRPILNLLYSKGKFTVSNMTRVTPYSHYVSNYDQDNGEGRDHTVTDVLNRDRAFTDNLSLRYAFNKSDRIDVYGSVYLLKENYGYNSVTGEDHLHLGNNLKHYNYNVGMQLRKGFGKNNSYVMLQAEYSKNKDNTGSRYVLNSYLDPANLHADMDNLSVKPRMYCFIKDNMCLSAGLAYYYLIDRHNDEGTQKFSYVSDNNYNSLGQDYEAWVQYDIEPTDRLFLRAGLSYHGSKSIYKDFIDRSRNIDFYQDGIYPTFTLNWFFNHEKSRFINVEYRHFFSLPNYNYLIPTMVWQNANMYSIGNPDLRKENYNNLLVYFSLNRALSIEYDFNFADDIVNVLMHQDETRPGVFYTSPNNTGNWRMHQITIRYSSQITKFWYTNTSIYGGYINENVGDDGYNWAGGYFNSYNDFSVCKNFGLSLSLFAMTKDKNASYISNARYKVSIGAHASLFKGKIDVNLDWANMLYNHGKITVKNKDFTYVRRDLSPDSRLQLSITWNFNAGRKIDNVNLPSVSGSSRKTPTF